ncbi:MAG: hypothetical protein ACOH2N_00500 [Devosia sp.]
MTTIDVRGVPTPINDDGHFATRRSNLWAVRLGFWAGRGHSANDVASLVGEGTSAGTVRGQLRRAGVLPAVPRRAVVPVEMASWQRDIIARHAAARGLTPQEIICQVLESALIFDDLYGAVTDGRYDLTAST